MPCPTSAEENSVRQYYSVVHVVDFIPFGDKWWCLLFRQNEEEAHMPCLLLLGCSVVDRYCYDTLNLIFSAMVMLWHAVMTRRLSNRHVTFETNSKTG